MGTGVVVPGGGAAAAASGVPGDPLILDPVKWVWTDNWFDWPEIVGATSGDPLSPDGNVLRSTDSDWGDLPGAIPAPVSVWPTMVNGEFPGTCAPVGSAVNVAAGLQIGDRIAFYSLNGYGYAGVYTITNLGSVTEPWELTRADDLTFLQSYGSWIAPIEGSEGPGVSRVNNPPTDWTPDPHDDWVDFSVGYGAGATAIGVGSSAVAPGAVALGYGATAATSDDVAVGRYALSSGDGAAAFGHYANATNAFTWAGGFDAEASGNGATALGISALATGGSSFALGVHPTASGLYSTAIGVYPTASGDYSQASGYYVVAAEEGVHVVGSYRGGTLGVPAIGNGGAAVIQCIETTQTGDFTLALKHMGRFIQISKATAVTVTIPTNATIAFPRGTRIDICQTGAGQVTISGGGVTIYGYPGAKTAAQHAVISLHKVDTDTWRLSGALAA